MLQHNITRFLYNDSQLICPRQGNRLSPPQDLALKFTAPLQYWQSPTEYQKVIFMKSKRK